MSKNSLLFLFFIVIIFLNLSFSNEIELIKKLESHINNNKNENNNNNNNNDNTDNRKVVNNKYDKHTSGYNFENNNNDNIISKGGYSISSSNTVGSIAGISSSSSNVISNKNDLNLSGGYSGSSGAGSTSGGSGLTGEYSTGNHPAHDTGSGTTAGLTYSICLYCDSNCRGYQKICVQAQPRTCTPIMNPCTKQTLWAMGSDHTLATIFDDFRCTVFNRTNEFMQDCSDCNIIQKLNTYITVCSYSS